MSTNPLLREAIDIFTQFAVTGGHKEYVGHLDSRLDPHLEALIEAAKAQLVPAPDGDYDPFERATRWVSEYTISNKIPFSVALQRQLHDAIAFGRNDMVQQTSARLKEAETRAKNCKDEALWFAKVLKVEEAKLPSLMYSGADLKAANLAAVARERAEVLAMWDQCGGIKVSMPDRAYQLKEYSPKCSQFIEQLHARLTQPIGQSGEDVSK